MARGSPNKKLLAPLGCQESSAPGNITGTVMANSIATRKSLQSSIFPHCSEGQFNGLIHGCKRRFNRLAVSDGQPRGLHISKFLCAFGCALPVPGE
ncbi:MAG: hypothetical protein DMG55_20250 [Acidobacteria bacterium]|nr:MAG: hypothetical protein DMG55_20250 [Acidobacteriota bacterium]